MRLRATQHSESKRPRPHITQFVTRGAGLLAFGTLSLALLPAAAGARQAPFYPNHWYAPVTEEFNSEGKTYEGPIFYHGPTGRLHSFYPPSAEAIANEKPAVKRSFPHLLVPGQLAQLIQVAKDTTLAAAPFRAPMSVKRVIWAGDELIGKPYVWGGGHGSWQAPGYDCSGSVSYALHAAGLVASPHVSGEYERWGERGVGTWITVFTNTEHVYMTVDGVRFDTVSAGDPTGLQGPRWRPLYPENDHGYYTRRP